MANPLSLFHSHLLVLHSSNTTNNNHQQFACFAYAASNSPPSQLLQRLQTRSAPSSNNQVYQPFRPPPSSVPSQFRSLGTYGRLEVLQNRLGLRFQYAPLIPSLFQKGVSPSSIEEATGISGVEQNRIVVAAKVRDSLVQSNFDPLEKEKVTERLRRDGEEEVPGLVDSCCSPLGKSSCIGKVAAVHHCSTLLSTLLHDE